MTGPTPTPTTGCSPWSSGGGCFPYGYLVLAACCSCALFGALVTFLILRRRDPTQRKDLPPPPPSPPPDPTAAPDVEAVPPSEGCEVPKLTPTTTASTPHRRGPLRTVGQSLLFSNVVPTPTLPKFVAVPQSAVGRLKALPPLSDSPPPPPVHHAARQPISDTSDPEKDDSSSDDRIDLTVGPARAISEPRQGGFVRVFSPSARRASFRRDTYVPGVGSAASSSSAAPSPAVTHSTDPAPLQPRRLDAFRPPPVEPQDTPRSGASSRTYLCMVQQGVAFRSAPSWEAPRTERGPDFLSVVQGDQEQDGWLRVDDGKYLPTRRRDTALPLLVEVPPDEDINEWAEYVRRRM